MEKAEKDTLKDKNVSKDSKISNKTNRMSKAKQNAKKDNSSDNPETNSDDLKLSDKQKEIKANTESIRKAMMNDFQSNLIGKMGDFA